METFRLSLTKAKSTHKHTQRFGSFLSFFLWMIVNKQKIIIDILLVGDLFFFCISICHSLMYATVFRSTVKTHLMLSLFFMHFQIFAFFSSAVCFNSCFMLWVYFRYSLLAVCKRLWPNGAGGWLNLANRVGLPFYFISHHMVYSLRVLTTRSQTQIHTNVCELYFLLLYLTQYNGVNCFVWSVTFIYCFNWVTFSISFLFRFVQTKRKGKVLKYTQQ